MVSRGRSRKAVFLSAAVSVSADAGDWQSSLNCEKQIMVLGYRDENLFLKDEFEAVRRSLCGNRGRKRRNEGQCPGCHPGARTWTADIIYACGPTPMLRAIKAYAAEQGIKCYISLEEKMACGIGACLACVCQSKDVDHHSNVHNKRICKDGPVFLSRGGGIMMTDGSQSCGCRA